jgi:hypothetical protein
MEDGDDPLMREITRCEQRDITRSGWEAWKISVFAGSLLLLRKR